MAYLKITVRIVKPWWLPVAVYLARQWFGWRAFLLNRELTDAELRPFVDWYGQQFRTVID